MDYISVIVPVYNVEKYLDKCVQSICNQTIDCLEIILVDDGSTDNSGALCDNWAKKDKRVRVFHKANGGLMSAWKYGVEHSTGKFIGFVDSDDWIEPNMYAELYKVITEQQCDIVTSGWVQTDINGDEIKKETIFLSEGKYTQKDIQENIFPIFFSAGNYSGRGLSPNRVTKLFRKNILIQSLQLCNDNVSLGEDLLTTFASMLSTKSIYVMEKFFPYHYVVNPLSLVHKYNSSMVEKIEKLRESLNIVNARYSYDFSTQINTDFIKLMLRQLESEILFSKHTYKQSMKCCRAIYERESFQEALLHSEVHRLPIKYRVYLCCMKNRLYSVVYVIRKAKKV